MQSCFSTSEINVHVIHLSNYKVRILDEHRAATTRVLILLALDEPTANLDTMTERELLACVREAARDRVVLLITHRLVGMEEMDEILVLDADRVVEQGTHEQLCAAGGLYSRLLKTQRGCW